MADVSSSLADRVAAVCEQWELCEKFNELLQAVGWLPAIAIAAVVGAVVIWVKWDDVKKVPGIAGTVAWLKRKPIHRARPNRLTIAVARLEDDANRAHEKLLRNALANEFEGADTKAIDRPITLPDADTEQEAITKATDAANKLREQAGADVLLWGSVLTSSGKSAMQLYWTIGPVPAGAKRTERYQPAETLALPELFWNDLKQVLGLLVQSRLAAIAEQLTGHYSADRLEPLIDQVRKLLKSRQGEWSPETDAGVRSAFADALLDYGRQTGDSDKLRESVEAYKAVLLAYKRDTAPLEWAGTQNSLGYALLTLGQRESGTARLEEAVAACRDALKEFTPERVPLSWASTQNNLGAALGALGERESGTARLEQAVTAFRAALEEWTRERVPLDWATAQRNLGTALLKIGQRESGTARLEQAVAALHAALQEGKRERVPLQWATTQNNLGSALWELGERETGTARLEEAVAAYREALKERTRVRVPLDWAGTQNNLGNALRALGQRESGTERLLEAVAAYRKALKEWIRGRVPLDWAMAQNNLGGAFAMLGERESGTARLEEAVSAFRDALEVFSAAGAEHYERGCRESLARARALLEQRRPTGPRLSPG
jgi:tetratricopeptide (TPR) repeat protein